MSDLLTGSATADIIEGLRIAMRTRIPKDDAARMVEEYRGGLSGLTEEAVRAAAKRAIQDDDYFPKVKRLRELALEFMSRTNAVLAKRIAADPDVCSICGARYEHHEITRKKVEIVKHENGRTEYRELREPMRGKDGQVLYHDGEPVTVPLWETVTSPRKDIYHDRAAHHVVDSLTA